MYIQFPDKYVRRNSRRNALLGGVLLNDPVNLLYKSRTVEVSKFVWNVLASFFNNILDKYMASIRSTYTCSRVGG